jgi:hypothetical protein
MNAPTAILIATPAPSSRKGKKLGVTLIRVSKKFINFSRELLRE